MPLPMPTPRSARIRTLALAGAALLQACDRQAPKPPPGAPPVQDVKAQRELRDRLERARQASPETPESAPLTAEEQERLLREAEEAAKHVSEMP